MPEIFINYRREDSSGYAGRIYDHLCNHFGEEFVFMDVTNIFSGLDFEKKIANDLNACRILLVVIGMQWLSISDNHGKRLDNPEDYVLKEISFALEKNKQVIPLLLDGTPMPRSHDLPDAIASLSKRNGHEISNASFKSDIARLIGVINNILDGAEPVESVFSKIIFELAEALDDQTELNLKEFGSEPLNNFDNITQIGDAIKKAQSKIKDLTQRMEFDINEGKIDNSRKEVVQNIFNETVKFLEHTPTTFHELLSLTGHVRTILINNLHILKFPSYGISTPQENSRTSQLIKLWGSVREKLALDRNRTGLGHMERQRSNQLLNRSIQIGEQIYKLLNDEQVKIFEREVARPFANEVRTYLARNNILLAKPIWGRETLFTDPNCVYFSGSNRVSKQLKLLCKKKSLVLLSSDVGSGIAETKWAQINQATVAVFDITFSSIDPERAAIAYELGIAQTLGKPVVVIAPIGESLPFLFDFEPISASKGALNEEELENTIDKAFFSYLNPSEKSTIENTIQYVRRHYGKQSWGPYVKQLAKQFDNLGENPDPFRAEGLISSLIGHLGIKAPVVITPTWPSSYPIKKLPSLFHTMPLNREWSNEVAYSTKSICEENSVKYLRADSSFEPRVIQNIWDELSSAAYIVADITTFDPNVAFDLGRAHTLGRKTMIVGRGEVVYDLFPMISKIRVHSYDDIEYYRSLIHSFLSK